MTKLPLQLHLFLAKKFPLKKTAQTQPHPSRTLNKFTLNNIAIPNRETEPERLEAASSGGYTHGDGDVVVGEDERRVNASQFSLGRHVWPVILW